MAEFQKRKQKTTWMVEILIYFWFSTKFVLKKRVDPKFVISFSEIRWKSCFSASFLRKIHNYDTHFSKSCVHMKYTCLQMTKSDFQIQHTCYTHVKSCVYLCIVQGSTLVLRPADLITKVDLFSRIVNRKFNFKNRFFFFKQCVLNFKLQSRLRGFLMLS